MLLILISKFNDLFPIEIIAFQIRKEELLRMAKYDKVEKITANYK